MLAREAWVYWSAAERFRVSQREGYPAPEEEDDLAVIFTHTEHPIIKRDCARMLDLPFPFEAATDAHSRC